MDEIGYELNLSCPCCDQSARQHNLTECNAICSPSGKMHRNLSENGTKTLSEHFFARFRCILFTRENSHHVRKCTMGSAAEREPHCQPTAAENKIAFLHITIEVVVCGDSNR